MAKSKFLEDFKAFAVKGNAVDMAVGVIIGGAFGGIVNSLVNDIIMPPIGYLIGGVNFTDLKVTLPAIEVAGQQLDPATIKYGDFIQTFINFLIIAFCVFLLVRGLARLKTHLEKRAAEEVPVPETPAAPAEPEPTKEEILLTEIRDLLAKK